MTDIVQRIVDAATEAIENQRGAILADSAGHLRGIVLDLEISNVGAVIDSRCFMERRGVHKTKKEPAA